MLEIKTGQAPNIPWWRLQTMSDEEIKKYNDTFMMIENLPDSVSIEELPEDIRKALNIEKDITLIIGNIYAKKFGIQRLKLLLK